MMIFGLNLALAIGWALVMGQLDRANLAVGFVLAYLVLWFVKPALGDTRYFEKLRQLLGFTGFLIIELVLSNLRVAREVLARHPRRRPAVVAVPLEPASDLEIAVLANFITLTPGTVTLDVAEDRSLLYVHTMFLDDPEALRDEIKGGFERRILELLR